LLVQLGTSTVPQPTMQAFRQTLRTYCGSSTRPSQQPSNHRRR